jgi:hypothetical protein
MSGRRPVDAMIFDIDGTMGARAARAPAIRVR